VDGGWGAMEWLTLHLTFLETLEHWNSPCMGSGICL
jgi:hypothetical protein